MNTNPPLESNKQNLSICPPKSLAGRFIFKTRAGARIMAAVALSVLGATFVPQPVSAATITFLPAVSISGDADVATNGTLAYAYTGGANGGTVNGEVFTAGNSGTAWGANVTLTSFGSTYSAFGANAAPFNTLSSGYSNILSGGSYGGAGVTGTVTLNNLTPGHSYSVQFWENDSRGGVTYRYVNTGGNANAVTVHYDDSGSTVGAVGQYAIGYFVADAATQSFTLSCPSTTGLQINAISVRDNGTSPKVWTGASSTSWGTAVNWNPANVPNAADSVLFNSSSSANLATMLNTSYLLATLSLSNAPSPVSVGNDGNTLTISAGINILGNSGQSLTISDPLVLGATQTWTVTNGCTLAVASGGISGTGNAALTLAGGGTVSFQAAATYTGNTTISSGNLNLTSTGSLASTNINVGPGCTLNNGGSLGATTYNVASNGTFALSGSGTIPTSPIIYLASGATFDVSGLSSLPYYFFGTLTNTAAGAVISGTNDCSSATISMVYDGVNPPFVLTNGTLNLGGGTVFNVNIPGSVLLPGTNTIIKAATTGNIGQVTGSLPSVNLTGNGAVGPISLLIDGSGDLQLVVGTGDVWTGAIDQNWSTAGNWQGGAGGGPYNNPTEPAVFNSLSTAHLNTIVDGNTVVNQLTILNPPSAVSIGGANTLEIGSSGGINMQSATVDLTISAPLNIAGNENWIIATNRTLNINGGATGGGGSLIQGGGTVNFNSASTVSGPSSVSSVSTLNLGVANALSASSDLTMNGLMNLQGHSQAMGALSGTGIVNNASGSSVTLTIGSDNGSGSFSGLIENTGGALALVVAGGNAALGSTNTYSGGTTFNGGQLYFGTASSSLGTGPVTFNPGSGVAAYGFTFTNALFLTDCLLRCGGNNFNQIWSGPISVTNGFTMSGDNPNCQIFLSGPINIGTGGISVTNQGNEGTTMGYGVGNYGDCLQGPITGSGGMTYFCNGGNSRITVQGANTYSGSTIVNGTGNGKLNVWGAAGAFSTGPVTLNAGAIIEAAPGSGTVTNSLTLNGGILEAEPQYNNYNTLTWAGPVTLTADSALVQYAVGALNNSQSSGVNVSGPLNMNGFTLTCSSPVACYGGNTISGPISGTGTIVENGANVLQLNGSNTFTGTFRSVLGTIGVGNAYAMQNATLDMNSADAGSVSFGANCVIGALTGSRNLSLGAGTVSIGNNNTPTTFTGTLSGNSLIKIGTSTLTVSANAYTGNTTVSAGTLSIGQTNLAFSSVVTVAGGAVLNLNFSGTAVVSALVLNGVSEPGGVLYGSGNSGGLITGTGFIQVGITPDVWTGAWSSEWSTNVLSSPKNWTSNSLAADFVSNNAAFFDDTLKSNNVVILTNNVFPIGVTFNNKNTNYTIGGSGSIAGPCVLVKNGGGSVTLTNNNTYTGNTVILSNTLTIATAGKLGNGNYLGGIYLGPGANLEYSSSSGQSLTGPITGSGGLIKDGPTKSDLTLSNTLNSYTGQTIITNGRLFVSSGANLGGGTAIVQTNQGQLYISAATTISNPMNLSSIGYPEGDANNNYDGAVRCDVASTLSGTITLSGNARIGNYAASGVTFTIGGQITGPFGIDFFGMNNGANSRNFLLSNTGNNFTGNASITCSDYASARTGASTTLKLGASEVIPNGAGLGIVAFNGADANHLTILEMNGFNETINGLTNVSATGAIIRNTATGASTLTIGDANTNSTFTGVITDGGAGSGKTLGITKIGSGTVTFTGLNAYNGNTTVSGGTLAISQATLSPVSTVTVAGGAVLQLNFAGQNPVSALVLNGVNKPPGVYNSGNSGGLITGTGSIVVSQQEIWTGAFSSEWSINTLASPKNWTTNGIAADYASGSVVTFDDTLTGTSVLNISAANVTPDGMIFNNSKTNYTLQGSFGIAGVGTLNKNGTASLTILNGNTYSGGTFVNAGTVEVDATSALGTGPVTMSGGVLTNNISATLPNTVNLAAATTIGVRTNQVLTLNGPLTSGGVLTASGGGTLVFGGTNINTGNTIIIAGTTLKFTGPASSSFPPSSAIYVLNNAGTNGVGALDMNGTTQTSTAYVPFMYSTTTTLTNGTLIDNTASTAVGDSHEDYNFMGTINLAPNGNYISNRRFIIGLNSAWANFTTTINSLNNTTNGSLTWGGDNNGNMNYVGVTAAVAPTLNINGGTVNFNNATNGTGNGYLNVGVNTTTSKGTININGANLNVGTWMKLGGNYNATTGQSGTAILAVTNGAVTVGGGSDAAYNGVLFMDGGNGDATANTGTSTLTLGSGGTLTVAQIQAGNNGTKTININGGTVAAGSGATNLFMSAATGLTVNLLSSGATFNSGSNNILIGSVLGNTGGLTKTGSGTLTLTNVNTYSGGTTISAGTLLANNPSGSGTGTGAVKINSGATLGGTGTIAGVITNNAGGILSPGVNGIGTFTVTNRLTLLAGSTNSFVVNGTTVVASNSVALGVTGAVTYGGVLNIAPNGSFTVGQTFTLFSGAGATTPSNFASIAGSPGAGKAFSFTNGVLSVVAGSSGPTLTSVTPNPVTGSSYGVTLTLTGSGFTGAGAGSVLLTNVTASTGASYTPATVTGDTSLTVNFVPGTTATTWNATVVNGGSSAQVPFTVTVPAKASINTGSLNSAGAGKLVLSGTGGVAGNSYAVVSATNLNPPVVWSPVVTNKFDGSGNFSYTNTVNSGTPGLFLRIQQ